MLVPRVIWCWLSEDFFHNSVVDFNGLYQILPVRLVSNLQRRPSGRKFNLPAKLSLSRVNIHFPRVSTSFQEGAAKLHPLARVFDDVTTRVVFQSLGGIDSSTLSANREVRQNLSVLLLSQNLLDYLANPLRIGKYRMDLPVEQSLRVSLDRRNVSVFDARLI